MKATLDQSDVGGLGPDENHPKGPNHITYCRVVDRLGIGRGPSVEILRGGLRKKYIVLRLVSIYNYPISVNIYIGCENKMAREITLSTATDNKVTVNSENVTATTEITGISKNVSEDAKDKTVRNNATISSSIVDNNSTSGNNTN
ncbi:jg27579 [Pararge aegeria aegeria]|uniref:Jg27579 protein n=1 Tax=Pararge aegeria aegeria TaxID=348720 RepID=A0A8S4SJP5_9NEOP|nr:jg27579 [Pararge aegeria aegeria]